MIVVKDLYVCPKCQEIYIFKANEPYEAVCTICKSELDFKNRKEVDTAKLNVPNPNYDCTKDPNHIMYGAKKIIRCPYCKSGNTSKIGVVGRSVSFGLFGFGSSKVGKNFHCNDCKADF